MTNPNKFLFNLVSNNDYIRLEQELNSNPKLDINIIYMKSSLLSKAIEKRTKECFDFILDNPNFKLIEYKGEIQNNYNNYMDSSDLSEEELGFGDDINWYSNEYYYPCITGLSIAIEYYINAPNPANLYWLNRLIEKNVYFHPSKLILLIDHPTIFNLVLSKNNTDSLYLKNILYDITIKSNINTKLHDVFKKLLGSLEDMKKLEPSDMYIYRILNALVSNKNIDLLDFMTNKGYDIRFIKNYENSDSILSLCFDNLSNNFDANFINWIFNYLDSHPFTPGTFIDSGIFSSLFIALLNKKNWDKFIQINGFERLNKILENCKYLSDLNEKIADLFIFNFTHKNTHNLTELYIFLLDKASKNFFELIPNYKFTKIDQYNFSGLWSKPNLKNFICLFATKEFIIPDKHKTYLFQVMNELDISNDDMAIIGQELIQNYQESKNDNESKPKKINKKKNFDL